VKRYKHINFTGFLFMQSNLNMIKLVSNNFVIHFFLNYTKLEII